MRIGIFGGTFDPPHLGHVTLARQAIRQLKLDKLYVIPCGNPVLKDRRRISAARHRIAMCRIAFAGIPRCEISTLETRRKRKSYTVLTLKHFRRKMKPGDELFLITGSDAAPNPATWYKFESIIRLCTVVVGMRKGFHTPRPEFRILAGNFPKVSSTELRNRLKSGKRVANIQSGVLDYIRRNCLY